MAHYIALIHKDPDSGYGISFPGPAIITGGDTIDEAMHNAPEVLASPPRTGSRRLAAPSLRRAASMICVRPPHFRGTPQTPWWPLCRSDRRRKRRNS